MKKTKVINLIGAPSCGKSLISALIFAEMKKQKLQVELIQEYIKHLIWKNDTEALKDQFKIAGMQYQYIKSLNGKIDFIILDTSLVNNIYYNELNDNKEKIKEWLNEFNNIFIFVERNEIYYFETEGRLHSFEESILIEDSLKILIKNLNLKNVINIKSNSDYKFIKNLVTRINY